MNWKKTIRYMETGVLACLFVMGSWTNAAAEAETEETMTAADGGAEAFEPMAAEDCVYMFRLYNPNSGEHFYTGNSSEREWLITEGWTYEGIGWKAPAGSDIPIYRMYNPNAGDHHYTKSEGEKDYLSRMGWNYEGIGFCSDPEEAVPLYREYNPNAVSGAHNYTDSRGEHESLIRLGWKDEGIAWYGKRIDGGGNGASGIGGTGSGGNAGSGSGGNAEKAADWPEATVFLMENNIRTLREAFDYVSGYRWIFYDVDPELGTHYYAMKGLQGKEGNCYVDAGLFCELANALGYPAVQIGGVVPRRDGSMAAHSWVEIDGKIYDPEYLWEYKREGGYAVIPGTPGTLRYIKQTEMRAR